MRRPSATGRRRKSRPSWPRNNDLPVAAARLAGRTKPPPWFPPREHSDKRGSPPVRYPHRFMANAVETVPEKPRFKRVLTRWDLIVYGLAMLTPTAAYPV